MWATWQLVTIAAAAWVNGVLVGFAIGFFGAEAIRRRKGDAD